MPNLPLPDNVVGLPVMSLANEITIGLTKGNVLLRAEPGAGKSTGLPLALLLQGDLAGKIILLEPRRLAARSVSERLASHLGEPVGKRIGLRMRSDTRVSAATRLEVVTEGVLTRILQNDPGLDDVALVIFDEFHERSIHADLGLALCLEVQQVLRNDLKLLLMSATLDTALVHDFLGDVTVFDCAVRQHPVDVEYLGDSTEPLSQRVVSAVLVALGKQQGDILVFLPGVAEINRTARLLTARLSDSSISLHKLHSGVSAKDQILATAPSIPERRRIILSTSLAETSITIDGVRVVIDSGLERRGRTDTGTGAQLLETVTASQASAAQRAGRAGRTAAGFCYRLWSEAAQGRRPAQWQPEILRADMSPVLMELGQWGASSDADLPWLTRPPEATMSRARELLTRLGLWEEERLSVYGRKVASLPVHPRLGHMLLWASERGALELGCRLVVWHEEPRLPDNEIDLERVLNMTLPAPLRRRVTQLKKAVEAVTDDGSWVAEVAPSSAVILAQAFPDWIAQGRTGQPGRFLLACGAGVSLNESSPLAHEPWMVVTHMGGAGKTPQVFRAISLDIIELENFSPQLFCRLDHLDWDDRQNRVIAEQRSMIGSLMVSVQSMQDIDDDARASALLKGIARQGIQCLPWTDECREWQARVQRISRLAGSANIADWPTVDDQTLLASLDSWLMPFLSGVSSMKALQQLELLNVLTAMLSYPQQVMLDEWLPTRYTVPSGSRIRLSYRQPGNPLLSVKLQEMLGCVQSPMVAHGQVTLKIELLSPAMRPIQITEDLPSFWTGSYAAVKKEMAGRYPKHVWPDKPWEALPTTRARQRKSKR